jgi:cardiolipin synthase
VAVFEDDWRRARPISLHMWNQRPLLEKIGGELAALVSAQL